MRVAAIVPMRHVSQRVPGKNYRNFCGEPLYRHVVRALSAAPSVAEIVIDTDSPVIRDDVAAAFPDVRCVPRPAHLTAPEIPMNEILMHDVGQIEADLYLQTHATNPLLRADTIERAVTMLLEQRPAHDSLFGVTRIHSRFWDSLARPINHNPAILMQTQDLPPIFEENSCLYVFDAETLSRRRNRIGERPILFEIDRIEALDIDEEVDFVMAEQIYLNTRAKASRRD